MSSNIRLDRICEECKKPFVAKTLFTRFCSHRCNSLNYKRRKSSHEPGASPSAPIIPFVEMPGGEILLDNHTYYEFSKVTELLRISERSLYRLLATGKIKKRKLLNKTFIAKEDLINFFENQ